MTRTLSPISHRRTTSKFVLHVAVATRCVFSTLFFCQMHTPMNYLIFFPCYLLFACYAIVQPGSVNVGTVT